MIEIFYREIEIFILSLNLLYKVNINIKSIINEFDNVRTLILEYWGTKANEVKNPL